MFEYVLFDLDGTLTDPKEGITKCVQYALKAFGIEEENLDNLECFIGPPLRDSFMQYYGFTPKQAEKAIEVYRERFRTVGLFENQVYEGIPQLLKACKEAGMVLAIASSKPTIFVKRILEHFALDSYFDVIVGAELDGSREKKEDIVEEALRQTAIFGLKKNEKQTSKGFCEKDIESLKQEIEEIKLCQIFNSRNCAMVGDRKFDVEGARQFQVYALAVRYGYAKGSELEDAGADKIVNTVKELQEFLMQ